MRTPRQPTASLPGARSTQNLPSHTACKGPALRRLRSPGALAQAPGCTACLLQRRRTSVSCPSLAARPPAHVCIVLATCRSPAHPPTPPPAPRLMVRSLFWRCFSALCYLVPWIDSISLGRHMYAKFRNLLLIYFAPGGCRSITRSSSRQRCSSTQGAAGAGW